MNHASEGTGNGVELCLPVISENCPVPTTNWSWGEGEKNLLLARL